MAEENNASAQYLCVVCNKHFTSTLELIKHKDVHPPSALHICFTCGNSFTNRKNLKIHSKQQHRIRYSCKVCSKVLETRSGFMRHRKSHLDMQHICAGCDQSFRQWEYLREHSYFCRNPNKNKHTTQHTHD